MKEQVKKDLFEINKKLWSQLAKLNESRLLFQKVNRDLFSVLEEMQEIIAEAGDFPQEIVLQKQENSIEQRRFTGFHDNTEWDELPRNEQKEFLECDLIEDDWCGRRIYQGDVILLVEEKKYYEVYFSNGCFRAGLDILCNIIDKYKIKNLGKKEVSEDALRKSWEE